MKFIATIFTAVAVFSSIATAAYCPANGGSRPGDACYQIGNEACYKGNAGSGYLKCVPIGNQLKFQASGNCQAGKNCACVNHQRVCATPSGFGKIDSKLDA